MASGEASTGDQLEHLYLTGVKAIGKHIGEGAYGKVFEVEFCGTVYAAKQIHSVLTEATGREGFEKLKTTFIGECLRGSSLGHQNVVQVLGVYKPEGQSLLPVLVMERMQESLTALVKRQPNIPMYVKLSILLDVSRGLWYLHSRNHPIVHRDLSPNNVLLTSNYVAKISDLGVAKVIKADCKKTKTRAPGTMDFMSPEALEGTSHYGMPLDVFSYGGVILHVVNQEWPTPLHFVINTPDGTPSARSEIERRQEHIDKMVGVPEDLQEMVKQCLQNNPNARPLISDVSERMQRMKEAESTRYADADVSHVMKQLELSAKRETNTPPPVSNTFPPPVTNTPPPVTNTSPPPVINTPPPVTNTSLPPVVDTPPPVTNTPPPVTNTSLPPVADTPPPVTNTSPPPVADTPPPVTNTSPPPVTNTSPPPVANTPPPVADNPPPVTNTSPPVANAPPPAKPSSQGDVFNKETKVNWEEAAPLPTCGSGHNAVLLHGLIYVGGGSEEKGGRRVVSYGLNVYDPQKNQWGDLIATPCCDFAMTVLKDELIIAGGATGNDEILNDISALDTTTGQWKPYSKMLNARYNATAVGYQSVLIIVGGVMPSKASLFKRIFSGYWNVQPNTELLDTTSRQWFTCMSIPSPHTQLKAVVVNDTLYMLGGADSALKPSPQVFAASLDDIATTHELKWQRLANLPLCYSTPVALFDKYLLTVGGTQESGGNLSNEVRALNPSTGLWKQIASLPVATRLQAAVSIGNKLIVIGGMVQGATTKDYKKFSNAVWTGIFE